MIQVGDRVVCIRDGGTWFYPSVLIVGNIYTVQGVMRCCSNDRLWLDVGLTAAGRTMCPDCRKHFDNNGKIWYGSILFVKVEDRVIEYEVKIEIQKPVEEPCLS